MTAIDIFQLAPPNVIESLDYETILAEHKAYFIGLYPVAQQADVVALLALESEPVVKLLENAAYKELILRARYNDEARDLLLAYAKGSDLDHIGETYYQEPRLLITPANPAAIPPVAAVYEDDDAYRARLKMKPESWSTAGPTEAYEFHALSASGLVKDAKATSPMPGTTLVTVLSREGDGVPTQALLDTVFAALNADKIRPQSEEVLVQAAQNVDYTLVVDLTLLPGAVGQVAVPEAQAALEAYTAASHLLGKSIVLSDIIAAAKKPGIYDVALNLVANIPITRQQAPHCIGLTVNVAGVAP